MEGLAEEVPLFGGEVRALLEGARGEMEQATRTLESGALPSAAKHTERAHAKLAELYEALARATKPGGGGLPFPLTLEQGGGEGGGAVASRPHGGEVHIPAADKNRAGALFREELLRAAKQKPPEHYEDAARRYYEELIR